MLWVGVVGKHMAQVLGGPHQGPHEGGLVRAPRFVLPQPCAVTSQAPDTEVAAGACEVTTHGEGPYSSLGAAAGRVWLHTGWV